jgi:4'-phosphopantetheinyl transferase
MMKMQPGLLVIDLELESWGAAHTALLDRLPTEEQRRIQRYRRDADRYRSLAAALLPRLMIAHMSKQPLACIRFERGPAGKPFYPADPLFHFNLSHSGSIAALAIGKTPVGVDVESMHPTNDWEAIAKRFFTPEEQHWLASLEIAQRKAHFADLWSRKESLLKASGEGLAGGLNTFSAVAKEDTEIEVTHRGERWFLRSYRLPPHSVLAVCSSSPGLPQPIRTKARAAHFIDDIEPAIAALAATDAVAADSGAHLAANHRRRLRWLRRADPDLHQRAGSGCSRCESRLACGNTRMAD